MLVFMGVVIAGIVLALYLPLFQLTSVIGATSDGCDARTTRSTPRP